MAQPGRAFRIFVSSTFEDLKEERNALQERVFPKLRELCTQYGCRFQAIDLRWGVSEEASLDQQTVKICLEEIKRCRKVTPRPNFIVLLGDRYGWRPLPYEIPATEFEEIERHIADVEEKRLLNTWYKRDDNAVPPVYCLQRRTGKPVIANGVKQSPQPVDYEDHAIWEKQVERPLRMALLNAVNKIDCFGQDPRNDDSSLRPVNEGGMSQGGESANGKQFPQSIASETKQSPTIDRLKYIASATEQEIVHGALTVPDASEHVFCFFRKINDLPVTPPPLVGQPSPVVKITPPTAEQASPLVIKTKDLIDLDEHGNPDNHASALLDNLKARLRTRLPGNIHEYNSDWKDGRITTSHIEKLCDDVYQSLSHVILREIEQFKDIDPLEKEITDHYAFGKRLTAFFVGRANIRKIIQDYVKSNARHPLVIYGESGSGKSAVVAQAISDCRMRMADYTIISRFIGATPTSSDGRSLLEGLCQEISRRYGTDQTNIPKEYRELVQELPKRLALATKEKPLVVFLDALDQLSDTDYARNLVWLPSELPENVSVVVSTLPGECLTALENKLSANNLTQMSLKRRVGQGFSLAGKPKGLPYVGKYFCSDRQNISCMMLQLEPMPQAEGEALLDAWLEDAGRRLQDEQRADILAKFKQNGLPLYLKLAFEEARRWKSYDGLPSGADKEPGLNKDVPGVIRDLFSRLSLELHHGRTLVSHCLSYLAAAKNGLTEDEMLDVLSGNKEVIEAFQRRSPKSPPVSRLPVVVWSRLYFDLEQYITERSADGTSLMTFFHRQFREVVVEDYLSGTLKQAYHRDLARYFWDQSHWIETSVTVHPHLNLPPPPVPLREGEKGGGMHSPQGNSDDAIQENNAHHSQGDPGAATQGSNKNSPPLVGGVRGGGELLQKDRDRKPNLRKVSELPYQQTYGEMKEQLETTLTDLDFLEAKCTAGMTYDLAADYDRLGVGRAQAGPPIRTAWVHEGKHGVMCPFCLGWNEIQEEQLGKVIPCPSCESALKLNPFTIKATWKPSGAQRKVDRTERVKTMDLSPDVSEFADFIRNQSHILRDYPSLMFQQAHNWPDNTAVHRVANKQLDVGTKTRPWLRWVNKPQQRDPCLTTLQGHSDWVRACAYSPDGRRIVSGSGDGTLKIWDAGSGVEVATLRGHSYGVRACAYSPNGRHIVSGSEDNTLKVWDTESGAEIATLRGHLGPVDACAYSPDGRRIVSWSGDYTLDNALKIWDAESGAEIATLRGHSGPVDAGAYSSDRRCIVSWSVDYTLKIWDAESGTEVAALRGHSDWVTACAYSPDGRYIVSGSVDMTLKIWDAGSGAEVATLRAHSSGVHACAYSPDGRRIVSGSYDGTIKIWDAESSAGVATLQGHSHLVSACAYSPDGRRIVSGSLDDTLKVWDAGSAAEVTTLRGHLKWVIACAYSPDGRCIVSGSLDYTLRVWDAESGMEVATLRGHSDGVNACAYSPDGRRIVSGSYDDTLKIWDAGSGAEVATLQGHSDEVKACAYSPDGRRIVSGSYDHTLKVWDAENGAEVTTLRGHSESVETCTYSPDGRYIVSGSNDRTLKIWDAGSGAEICTFVLNGHVKALALNPGGTDIFAGDSGGMVYLLRLKGLAPGPVIITPWRLPTDGAHAFGCVHCRVWSEIPASAISTGLPCPNCGKPVKLNPFTINADWRPIAKAWQGKS